MKHRQNRTGSSSEPSLLLGQNQWTDLSPTHCRCCPPRYRPLTLRWGTLTSGLASCCHGNRKPGVRFCGSGERGEQGAAHLKLGRLSVKNPPSGCSSCTEEARVRLRPGPFPPRSDSGVTATLPMMQHCWACGPTPWGPLLEGCVPAAERPVPRSPPTSRWEPPRCCLDHQNQNRTVRTAEWTGLPFTSSFFNPPAALA